MQKSSLKHTRDWLKNQLKIDSPQTVSRLENFIKEYTKKLEREGIILGLSGGIDSAVVAALCTKAVGPEKVLALILPDKDSKKEHLKDALKLANQLKIQKKIINITSLVKKFGAHKLFLLNKFPLPEKLKENLIKKFCRFYEKKSGYTPFSDSLLGFKDKNYSYWLKTGNAYYRIKHRIRMILLYLYAEQENRLVVGAANKTESKIGFFVKHGCDDAADIMPLLGLYKTQVRQLALFLKIPKEIINKPPSPDIIPGIIDEEAIGIAYEKLDFILKSLELAWPESKIATILKIKENEVEKVKKLKEKSEHMRQVFTPV